MRRQARSSPCSRATANQCGPWHSRPTESTSSLVISMVTSLLGTSVVQLLFSNNLRSRSRLTLAQMCAALKRCRGMPLRSLTLRTLASILSYGTKRLAGSPGKPRKALFRCRFAGSQLSVAGIHSRAMAPQLLSEQIRALSPF
jgi:hypothetical protein